jgi:Xaa-Pro aminopeptidase
MTNRRAEKLLNSLKLRGLDGLLISCAANISYLTKTPGQDTYLLVSQKGWVYFTDSRYLEQARRNLPAGIKLEKINSEFYKAIASACGSLRLKEVGFEERVMPYAEAVKIKEHLPEKSKFLPCHGIVEGLRKIKEPQEIVLIREAARITSAAISSITGLIRPGIREIELAGELERAIRYHGGIASAFDIICAFGSNSAFPHHIPSSRKLGDNQPVLIDAGAEFAGYKSDLTRVFFTGKINILARRVYQAVLYAQKAAIRNIRPSLAMGKIDSCARGFLQRKGWGRYFTHSLGHGIGLEVHEEPRLRPREETRLEPGMVVTIEPAVYLPGKFGIRLEDMVLVTKKGCEVLSGSLHK